MCARKIYNDGRFDPIDQSGRRSCQPSKQVTWFREARSVSNLQNISISTWCKSWQFLTVSLSLSYGLLPRLKKRVYIIIKKCYSLSFNLRLTAFCLFGAVTRILRPRRGSCYHFGFLHQIAFFSKEKYIFIVFLMYTCANNEQREEHARVTK